MFILSLTLGQIANASTQDPYRRTPKSITAAVAQQLMDAPKKKVDGRVGFSVASWTKYKKAIQSAKGEWLRVKDVQNKIGCTEDAARRMLGSLARAGYVEVKEEERNSRKCKLYKWKESK